MRAALLLVLCAVVCPTASAAAPATAEEQLAAKYAPIVGLKEQSASCDPAGEPYRPVPADVVLGRRDVELVDSDGALIKTAPTAADLFTASENDYLDFPGDALDPGCSYEKWADEISRGAPTTAYTRIVTEPGKPRKLALQYWLYYVFNDWANKHESDWEMVQLMFDASTPSEALKTRPEEVGYSQHSGAERASWDDSKLQKRGSHPIVYPGNGSHANYFSQSLWLGHSAEEGFGCDDTRSPSRLVQTDAVLLPSEAPTSAKDEFAWIAYTGHWGEKERGPNTGPTGPNMKAQWTEPVTWADDTWRQSSAAVPLQKTVGTSTTSFFCGAVAWGSNVYLRFLRTPWFVLAVILAACLLGVWLSRRTRWSPGLADPVDQARPAGEIYRAGWRLYRRHWQLFLGIGLVFLPIAVIASIVQAFLFDFTGLGDLESVVDGDAVVSALIALGLGQVETLIATVLVVAAVAVALERIDDGERPGALDAYRGLRGRVRSLAWAWLRVVVISGLLAITVIGIPVAVVYLVRKSVLTQACVLEQRGATAALRRSDELVRRHGPRVFAITALVNVTAYLAGPTLGVLVLFLTSSSLAVINLISSLVYVVVMPYAGAAITLLFYDLRRRLARGEAAVARPALASP